MPNPNPPARPVKPSRPAPAQLLRHFRKLLPRTQFWQLPSLQHAGFYDRLFNPLVTLWYFIFQRLQGEGTLHAALADAWAGGADRLRPGLSQKLRSEATTALSDARQRLPLALFKEVLALQVQALAKLNPAHARWRGLALRLLDGTTVRLRPYGDMRKHFPPNPNQSRRPAYWCLMRVVVSFCVHTGAALGCAISGLHGSEQALAAQLILEDPGRFLYIGDANFGIFRIAQAARTAGAEVLVRLTPRRARRLLGRTLKVGTHPVRWSPSPQDQPQPGSSVAPIPGRLLVVRLRRPGFRAQTLYLFTSLNGRYPAAQLVTFYGWRWHIELNLRYLKTQMGLAQLECKSAAMAQKEWFAGLLAYNLVRAGMLCAATTASRSPRELSFSAARRHLQIWFKAFGQGANPLRPAWVRLLRLMAHSRLPQRRKPRPAEPRAQRHLRLPYRPLFGSRAKARRQLKKDRQKS